jgi:hypothetical protein
MTNQTITMTIIKTLLTLFTFTVISFNANAGVAFKTGEKLTGTTKQCYYKYLGSEYTKTIKAHELCPLSIQV